MDVKLRQKNEKLLNDIERLVDEVVSFDELKELLNSGKKLTIKYGVDCTAPFLHLGHAVNLWTMRRFQEDGHKVVFLIGNFTSKIGDPTGKSKTRKVLTDEFIKQVSSVLITDNTEVFEIRRNSEWFDSMSLQDFLSLCSMMTHARLITRDMFQSRIEHNEEIHINELLYPILQGYDSVMLDSDLTIVGSDQLFNEMMGRFFQEKFGQKKQVIMTTKITKGLWGEEKQSKSIGNFVALADSSKNKFGKIMQLGDDRIVEWMKVYSDIDLNVIEDISSKLIHNQINPRDAKMFLAHAIVKKYHGQQVADKEQRAFIETFSRKNFPTDAPIINIDIANINIVELLSRCFGNGKSKSEIRRLILQNAVILNGRKVDDINEVVNLNEENQLKVGKRQFFKVVIHI